MDEKSELIQAEINKETTKNLKVEKYRKQIELKLSKISVIENRFKTYQHHKIDKLSFVNSMISSQTLHIEQMKELEIDLNHNDETLNTFKQIQDNDNERLSKETWENIKGEEVCKFKKEHLMKCEELKQKTIDFGQKKKEHQAKMEEMKKKLQILNKNNYDQNKQNKETMENLTEIEKEMNIKNQTIAQTEKIQNELKEWKQKLSAEKQREHQLNHNDNDNNKDEEDEDHDLNQNNQRYQEPIDLTSDGENEENVSNHNKSNTNRQQRKRRNSIHPFGFDQAMYDEIQRERYSSMYSSKNSRKRSYPQNRTNQRYPRKKIRKRYSLSLSHHRHHQDPENDNQYQPDQDELDALTIIANNGWSQDQSSQNQSHSNHNNHNNHNHNNNTKRSDSNEYY